MPEPVIRFTEVKKSFGSTTVLDGVSFSVDNGVSAVVMGASGTGKSVLIKHLVQLLRPDSGEVWLNGERMDQLKGAALDKARLSVGYLFQNGALYDSLTVYENLSFALERHTELSQEEIEQRIIDTLAWVNLEDMIAHYPAELSGGQKKRIGLARAIIMEPDVMLYDEPTTGLDPAGVRTVSDLIVRLEDERNVTSITITHDLLCAEIIADEVHFLSDGRIVESGTLPQVRQSDHPAVRNFFGHTVA